MSEAQKAVDYWNQVKSQQDSIASEDTTPVEETMPTEETTSVDEVKNNQENAQESSGRTKLISDEEFDIELKTAFLFSCLTGLRKSDVKPFTWEMIQPEADGTLYVTDCMQKTKQIVHNPIEDEALVLIDSDTREGLVFPSFKDSMTQTTLVVAAST